MHRDTESKISWFIEIILSTLYQEQKLDIICDKEALPRVSLYDYR